MRIVVDAMGGDHGCDVVIEGVIEALQAYPGIAEIYLVGQEPMIEASLKRSSSLDARVKIVHASEVLTMEDKPVEGLRRKKDCSILRGLDLLKSGQAEAFISSGNTGGLVAGSAIRLGKLEGVDRPAIATIIPSIDHEFVLLDSGASVESRPLHLVHYAIMGSVYSQEILGRKSPRVGLLSNGSEPNKGSALIQESFKLLKQVDLNFIGNVEGHDLFQNKVDVVVCDGLVGNIVLKTVESFAKALMGQLRAELSKNPKRMIGAWLARDGLRALKRRMDPDLYGGAPILGLNGNVLKAHGSAGSKAIMNAIRVTIEALQHQINRLVLDQVRLANERLERGIAAAL